MSCIAAFNQKVLRPASESYPFGIAIMRQHCMNDFAQTRRANLNRWVKTAKALHDVMGGSYPYWRNLLADPKKSFGEKTARRIEEAFGWPSGALDEASEDSQPAEGLAAVASRARIDQGGLALDHRLSYQAVTVPHLTREELIAMGQKELPNAFRIELLDDALGARAPRGTSATFERREPMWGDAVLLLDAKGEPHVRVYRQSLEHEWEGYAPNPNFATFTGSMSGVRVVAVLESLGGGWAQLGR